MRAVTLTLHPAIDRVLRVETLAPGATFDGHLNLVVPAGKGVNTARALSSLWRPQRNVVSVAWIGEDESDWFSQHLSRDGITPACCARGCATRQTMTLLERSGRETHVKESMPAPSRADEERLLRFWAKTVRPGDIVALCGSAPPSTRPSVIRRLVEIARSRKAGLVVADSHGAALKAASEAGLDGIKGNAVEIGGWLKLSAPFDPARRTHRRALMRAFDAKNAPRSIVITRGAEGALAVAPGVLLSGWVAQPALRHALAATGLRRHGSATGCGDAVTAGWLWALRNNCPLNETLRRAVACGTAKLAEADPGRLDPHLVSKLLPLVHVEERKI